MTGTAVWASPRAFANERSVAVGGAVSIAFVAFAVSAIFVVASRLAWAAVPVAVAGAVSAGPSVSVVPGDTTGALDGREVVVPIAGASRIRVDNPLGNVTVRAWGRPDAVHIVAEKHAAAPDGLGRLRVHFTAWSSGEISVETRVDLGGRERALPLIASGVDLVVEVPADLEVAVKTFAGRIVASGLRSATRLETTGGRIEISDVRGRVVTRQLRGGQSVAAVDGDLQLDGVEGQMHLERLGGTRVEARIVDGDIRAEDVRSDEVQLASTTGEVVLIGVLRPYAHYDLRSYKGDVRLNVLAAAMGFELRARSALPLASTLNLQTIGRQGTRTRALMAPIVGAGMKREPRVPRGDDGISPRPIVELTSVMGRVVVEAPQTLRADQDNRSVRW